MVVELSGNPIDSLYALHFGNSVSLNPGLEGVRDFSSVAFGRCIPKVYIFCLFVSIHDLFSWTSCSELSRTMCRALELSSLKVRITAQDYG